MLFSIINNSLDPKWIYGVLSMSNYENKTNKNEAIKRALGASDEQKREKQERINATFGKRRWIDSFKEA